MAAAERELLFSVTLDDCEVETFMVGGAGGQHRDRTSSGVRITHAPSGATGRGVDSRSQHVNKRDAFIKMTKTPQFLFWLRNKTREVDGKTSAEAYAAAEIQNPQHLLIETKDEDGRWKIVEYADPLDAKTSDRTSKRKH